MLLNCGVGEESCESLGQQGNKTSHSYKKSILNIHWRDWCWSSITLATWWEELTHWKRPWCWERLQAGGKGDDRGWDGLMASSTQWMSLSNPQELVIPSNHLIPCYPLFLLPLISPSIRIFSNDLALRIRWPNNWSFSSSISPSSEHSGLLSFRIDWFDLLANVFVQSGSPSENSTCALACWESWELTKQYCRWHILLVFSLSWL